MGGISITCSLSKWGLELRTAQVIRVFFFSLNWSQGMPEVSLRRQASQSHNPTDEGAPCSAALKLGQYIRKSHQHLCQHCFMRNMRIFCVYVLSFHAFAWVMMAGRCLISVTNFIFELILFHTRNIKYAFISQSRWYLIDKARWFILLLHEMLMHEQRKNNHQSDHIIYGNCYRLEKY